MVDEKFLVPMDPMNLVIAEKPSVAQSVAKVLGAYKRHDGYLEGSGYIVSWCYGHLAEYAMPEAYGEQYKKWRFEDLPIIPGSWKLEVAKDKKKQVEVLKCLLSGKLPETEGKDEKSTLFSDEDFLVPISCVVNACDAGREGELIFRHVYELAKSKLPIKRLWISSMEDEAIREGFDSLKDGKNYENLYAAAVCRAKADWLVGMNASRGFSTIYNSRISVGRVQSPTLAMIVDRQQAIENFKKEPYYRVMLTGSGIAAVSENFKDEAEADALMEKCNGKAAIITKVEKVPKRENPPKLYDLTSLQRDANRLFGYTAQQTLDMAQELYEAKLITYPRTDSRYITSDMEKSVGQMLEILAAGLSVARKADEQNVERLICDSKVTDHHAIIPTHASMEVDIEGLSDAQRNIYLMVATRLAAAAAGARHLEKTHVEVTCVGEIFKAKGTTVLKAGYQAVEDAFLAGYVKPEKVDGEVIYGYGDENAEDQADSAMGGDHISVISILDEVFEGKEIEHPMLEKSQRFTTPPKAYTEDSLLAAMEKAGAKEMDDDVERKGLGTPATRAGIIEKLVNVKYIARKGRKIIPTERGVKVAGVLPESLKSAELTADWENELLEVERGKTDGQAFMGHIFDQIDEVLDELGKIPLDVRESFEAYETIGECPACGRPVVVGKGNYHCSNSACRFILWEDNKYLASMKGKIDRNAAEKLCAEGRVMMKGLYSQKKDKKFDAWLVLDIGDKGMTRFSLEFPKKKRRK